MAEIPDLVSAVVASIAHWPRLLDLAAFAVERRGFGDSDGGFGITYPNDLDDYDRQVERIGIPEGFIQVYGFWGPPDGYEVLIPETLYLEILAPILADSGHCLEAAQVRRVVGVLETETFPSSRV